jgi:hypothetical protein
MDQFLSITSTKPGSIQDDISHSDQLGLQVAFMSENPDVAVIGSSYDIVDNHGFVRYDFTDPISDVAIR